MAMAKAGLGNNEYYENNSKYQIPNFFCYIDWPRVGMKEKKLFSQTVLGNQ